MCKTWMEAQKKKNNNGDDDYDHGEEWMKKSESCLWQSIELISKMENNKIILTKSRSNNLEYFIILIGNGKDI